MCSSVLHFSLNINDTAELRHYCAFSLDCIVALFVNRIQWQGIEPRTLMKTFANRYPCVLLALHWMTWVSDSVTLSIRKKSVPTDLRGFFETSERERIEAQRGISISTTRYPNFFVSLAYFSTSTFSRVHPQDYFRSYFQLNSIHRPFL